MHKLVIPIQHRGFPREAQKLVWSLLGFIALAALWTDPWKGGWHLIGCVAISLLEFILITRPLRKMIAPARLGGHSLADMDRVSVEVHGEGKVTWLDQEGLPIELAPDEAWRCWLAVLSHNGFPASATGSGCFRLRLEWADAVPPMPRRYPEYAPGARPDCSQPLPAPSTWPFWCLFAFFCALLIGSVIVGIVEDPMLAALGGGPVSFLTGGFLLNAWISGRQDLQSLAWHADEGFWLLSAFSGKSAVWYPGSQPISPKKLAKVGSHLRSPVPEEIPQPGALTLFLDDQAHAAWQAKRGKPVFTHSKLEQDSL